jgi:hypothetical protein
MMVIAMQSVNKLLRPATLGNEMKKEPVYQVFKQGPEHHSSKKGEKNPEPRIVQPGTAVIKHINHDRQVHSPDHQGMSFGQHFKKTVPEQSCLALIMNLLKFHNDKDRLLYKMNIQQVLLAVGSAPGSKKLLNL